MAIAVLAKRLDLGVHARFELHGEDDLLIARASIRGRVTRPVDFGAIFSASNEQRPEPGAKSVRVARMPDPRLGVSERGCVLLKD